MHLTQEQKEYLHKKQWHIEFYTPALRGAYQNLVVSEYGEKNDIAQADFIDWQYSRNPAGSVALALMLDASDRAVGTYGVLPVKVMQQGTVKTAAVSINTITRKELRGQGIFAVLANVLCQNAWPERGISFIYGFPNQNSYPGFVKRFSFTDIGHLTLMLKPFSLDRVLGSQWAVLRNPLTALAGRLVFPPVHAPQLQVKAVVMKQADTRFTDLWLNCQKQYVNAIVRDERYIRWRYFDSPIRKYHVIGAVGHDNRLAGYMVIRPLKISGLECCLIGDAMIQEQDAGVFKTLLTAVEAYCRDKNLSLAGALLPRRHVLYSLFRSAGYFPCPRFLEPQPFPVIMRELDGKNPSLFDLCQWYFTMGDYDVF